MSKKTDHITNSEKDYFRYSANEMTEKERNAFEKNLQKDAFEKDAQEGLSDLSPEQIKADISELKSRLYNHSSTGRFFGFRIAAGLAILLAISSLFYLMLNHKITGENGPLLITESAEVPNDEKDRQEPQIEILNKPGKNIESVSTKKRIPAEKMNDQAREQVNEKTVSVAADSEKTVENTKFSTDYYPAARADTVELNKEVIPTATSKSAGDVSSGVAILSSSQRQEPKIFRGRIVSSDDYQPIPGVSVQIKGTTSGTVTDFEGKFELPVKSRNDTIQPLKISFVGMENQEIIADAGTELNIVMNPSLLSLNEVIVTGSGRKQKNMRTLTAESASIQTAEPIEGQKSFENYITEHQQFPSTKTGISEANVILEFLVDENGKPIKIKVLESPGKEFSDEAIRLLKNGPRWLAASPSTVSTQVRISLTKVKE
jgi:outer membrane biosynthesis protein TonB